MVGLLTPQVCLHVGAKPCLCPSVQSQPKFDARSRPVSVCVCIWCRQGDASQLEDEGQLVHRLHSSDTGGQ